MTDQQAPRVEGETASVSEPLCQPPKEGDSVAVFPENRRADEGRVDSELSVFKALANDTRIRIIEALRQGELCVCELETVLDAPQSTVASHLATLRDVGIVRTRRDGKWTYYRIADTASLQLLDLAASLGEAE